MEKAALKMKVVKKIRWWVSLTWIFCFFSSFNWVVCKDGILFFSIWIIRITTNYYICMYPENAGLHFRKEQTSEKTEN